MKAKYVNPFTDFGFKKIFGEEASKPLLLDFFNSLLPASDKIKSLAFKNTGHLGQTKIDRKSKEYRDTKGYIDSAYDEGKTEGKIEEIIEVKIKLPCLKKLPEFLLK